MDYEINKFTNYNKNILQIESLNNDDTLNKYCNFKTSN